MAESAPRKIYPLVVAFDFGTTYSGYAFSFRDQFEKNNLDITINSSWTEGSDKLLSKKTPTSLLISADKKFVAFGSEAEKQFMELAEDDLHKDYYFFKRFKMKLHNRTNLKRGLKMKDETGKPLSALSVFAFAIYGLKKHFYDKQSKTKRGVPDDDEILYVITVPAIWNDAAKQFMREAAVEAGIRSKNVLLALEPEAASLYCQLLPIDKLHTSKEAKFTVARAGTVFMVADLGGGTADITVHRRENNGELKERHIATGGPWGGVGVDREFLIFISKLMGTEVMKEFSKNNSEDMLDMYKCLEALKRTVGPDSSGIVQIDLPYNLCEVYKKVNGEQFGKKIPEEFQGKVTNHYLKLKIDVSIVKSFFEPVVEGIISHIKQILAEPECKDVKNILLVGGFSESNMIISAVEATFPNYRHVVPYESETAVLKGAVLFGHSPGTISTRVMRYTYGVSYMVDFVDGVHPEEKKRQKSGELPKCKDLFEKFVEIGQSVDVGQVISKSYNPARDDMETLLIKVYASTQKSPLYVTDDGCWKLGKLVVKLPANNKNSALEIQERMVFGETELRVEAIEPTTGNVFSAKFDFL